MNHKEGDQIVLPAAHCRIVPSGSVCRFIWELILHNRVGRAILLTTHSMVEADLLCDDIAIMANGQLMAQGTPAELKQQFGAGFTLTLTVTSGRYKVYEPA